MDPFPRPSYSTYEPIQVYLLAGWEYDFAGLEEFPERCGLTKDGELDLNGQPTEQIASFIQCWLYFGLLAEFIGQPIDKKAFVKTKFPVENEARELTLASLDHILASSTLRPRQREKRLTCIRFCVEQSLLLDRTVGILVDDVSTIILSVKVLLITLIQYIDKVSAPRHMSKDILELLEQLRPKRDLADPAATLLAKRLFGAGWCPMQTQRLLGQYDYSVIYYLLQLRRWERKGLDHSKCSTADCTAYNIDMDQYSSRHRSPGCQCESICVPTEEMEALVRKGKIPLAYIKRETYGKMSLKVTEATARSQYIAISHVWADGLGNPSANALPQCQIEELERHFHSLPSPESDRKLTFNLGLMTVDFSRFHYHLVSGRGSTPFFWMDTLCVPLNRNKEGRKIDDRGVNLTTKAINQMAAIYAGASQTLVLDAELQKVQIGATQHSEMFGYLTSCAWMTRAWTLQEGALSTSCYFQYADGTLQPTHRWRQIYHFRKLPRKIVVEHKYMRPLKVAWDIYVSKLYQTLRLKKSNVTRHPDTQPTHQKDRLKLLQNHITTKLHQGSQDSLRSSWNSELSRDKLGQASSMSSVEQLSAIWNALVFRSTTKKEDLPAILANLLDFNAYQILSEEPQKGTVEIDKRSEGNAIRAILWSLEEIPLSLLYNAGPRVRADQPHKNRWLPLAPTETTISAKPMLKFNSDGFSVNSHEADDVQHKTQLCVVPFTTGNVGELAVDIPQTNSRYRIIFLRAPGDTFDPSQYKATCFLFETPGINSQGKGACLRVSTECPDLNKSLIPCGGHADMTLDEVTGERDSSTPRSGSPERNRKADVLRFQTIYDCPIRVYIDAKSPSSDNDVGTVAGNLIDSWYVNIEHDTSTWNGKFPRRPLQVSPVNSLGTLIFVFVSILFGIPSLALRVVIAVQDFKTSITVLGVLSLVIMMFGHLVPPPLGSLVVIASLPMFIIDETQRGGMSSLDASFVVLFFFSQLVPYLISGVWISVFPVFAYRAWLATFDEGWEPNQSYRWIWRFSKLVRFDMLAKLGLERTKL